MGNHIEEAMRLKLAGKDSCLHCALLYHRDTGYSNYTVEETTTDCAIDNNPNLPADTPSDWTGDKNNDNWPKTNHSLCAKFIPNPGDEVHFDVDGEITTDDYPKLPAEARALIKAHANCD